jgi:hypothetical protein
LYSDPLERLLAREVVDAALAACRERDDRLAYKIIEELAAALKRK